MTYELISILVVVTGAVFTGWLQLSNNIEKLNQRVKSLERSEDKINTALNELLSVVQEIKIMLAEKGIR